jgi:methylenetetrahydrofolate reductase (NADPH)
VRSIDFSVRATIIDEFEIAATTPHCRFLRYIRQFSAILQKQIMKSAHQKRSLLVISQRRELRESAGKAAGPMAEIIFAVNEAEGRAKIQELRPDIIILGPLNSQEEIWRLYAGIRGGWISHHASLLILEMNIAENKCRILGDDNLVTSIGEYVLSEGAASLYFPADQLVPKLQLAILEQIGRRDNRFKNAMLDPDKFCLVWEQIPGPGAFEMRQEQVLENARRAARSGIVCAISITDNPGGNPAIATDILCAEIKKAGIDPLVHIAFRDRSRNQAESLLFQLAALNINNVLILTGDYPSNLGFRGRSKPVFDLDSVNGLRLVAEMNQGLERDILRKPIRLAPTDFFAGVAFSPFKQMEAEVMGQFYKMQKKIKAGADFAITQVGYDARKLQEFQMWLKAGERTVPVLASVYVLSHPVARAMHGNNIPGCVVTAKLLNQLAAEVESKDKGRQARLDRAAKMFAVVKGLGYKGAYISGQGLPFESVEYIVARGNEFLPEWMNLVQEFDYPQENGFYYYKPDAATGLNATVQDSRTQRPIRPPTYLLSRVVHECVFEPKSLLFKPMRRLARFVDSSRTAYRLFYWLERWSKSTLYECKDCGDCALFDAAYLCPVSQCPKDQRNAPCGGSYHGWCEVYPEEKQCIWVRAYRRLKSHKREDEIGQQLVPPCNWELYQTSSWINYFLGRDHSSKARGIKATKPKA